MDAEGWLVRRTGEHLSALRDAVFLRGVSGLASSRVSPHFPLPPRRQGHAISVYEMGSKAGKKFMGILRSDTVMGKHQVLRALSPAACNFRSVPTT